MRVRTSPGGATGVVERVTAFQVSKAGVKQERMLRKAKEIGISSPAPHSCLRVGLSEGTFPSPKG